MSQFLLQTCPRCKSGTRNHVFLNVNTSRSPIAVGVSAQQHRHATRCHLGLTCLHRMPYDSTEVVRDDNGCRTSCCFVVNCWETINERPPRLPRIRLDKLTRSLTSCQSIQTLQSVTSLQSPPIVRAGIAATLYVHRCFIFHEDCADCNDSSDGVENADRSASSDYGDCLLFLSPQIPHIQKKP